MCLGCDNKRFQAWCMECAKELSAVDKWYLVGLNDAWRFAIQSYTPEDEAKRREEAYEMGCADRIGYERLENF